MCSNPKERVYKVNNASEINVQYFNRYCKNNKKALSSLRIVSSDLII